MKCLNETIKQLVDSVMTVQDNQCEMSSHTVNLANKVLA